MPSISGTVQATPSASPLAVMAEPLGKNPHVASTTATPQPTYQASAVAHLQPTSAPTPPDMSSLPIMVAVAAGSVVGLVGIVVHRLVDSHRKIG